MSTDADVAVTGSGDEDNQPAVKAPYMSYKGFKNYLSRFVEDGIPARFDGSYFGNASGSLVAQVRGTLRYFDFIDDDKHPTQLLREVVDANEADRKAYLRMMFEEKYVDALALDKNATSGQLADIFRARGLSGATVQKAITFFLGMAEDVGMPLSPHFKKGRATTGNATRARRVRIVRTAKPSSPATSTSNTSQPKVKTVDEQKAAYVTMLMELAQKDDAEVDVQKDLLDRIERVLGINTSTPTEGGQAQDVP